MLERIRSSCRSRIARAALLTFAAHTLVSCATKPPQQLVSDPDATAESAIPWNQQQKWEGSGQFGPLAEEMAGGRR